MPQVMRKTAIVVKPEGTYGVDSAPTGAANAVLVRDANLTPLQQNLVSRDLVRSFFGNSDQLPASNNYMLEFSVEMAGSGTAGTPPAYAPLLIACGTAETDTVSDDTYNLTSAVTASVTIWVEIDGVLHKGTGCRGDVSWVLDAAGIPLMKFSFIGRYVPVVDGSITGVSYTAYKKPVPVNKANTTATLWGYAGVVIDKLTINLKNEYPYRNLIGYEGVTISDRKPDGNISIEMTKVAAKDWTTTIAAGGTGALQIVHGTTAGNICQFDAPAVQLVSPRFSNSQGVQMLEAGLLFMPNTGNDEIVFTVK